MNWDVIWKLAAGLCSFIRWLTRRKPRRGPLLIVEDNLNDARILQHKLARLGQECDLATSGEEASGLVKHTFYPVAFIDLRLPTMSGEEVVQLLSEQSPKTRILYVCGEHSDLRAISRESLVMYVLKPPPLEALADFLGMLKL